MDRYKKCLVCGKVMPPASKKLNYCKRKHKDKYVSLIKFGHITKGEKAYEKYPEFLYIS